MIPDVNAMLTNSDEMEKSNTLQMANLLLPLFQLPQQAVPSVLKPAKQIVLAFRKDPDKWFPDSWMKMLQNPDQQKQQQAPGTDPSGGATPDQGKPQPIAAQKAATQVAPAKNKPVGTFTKILKAMNIGGGGSGQ